MLDIAIPDHARGAGGLFKNTIMELPELLFPGGAIAQARQPACVFVQLIFHETVTARIEREVLEDEKDAIAKGLESGLLGEGRLLAVRAFKVTECNDAYSRCGITKGAIPWLDIDGFSPGPLKLFNESLN